MNDELKAELNKRIAAIFDSIHELGAVLESSNSNEILKWIDAQSFAATSDDDESLAYALSSLGDDLIDYGKEFNVKFLSGKEFNSIFR